MGSFSSIVGNITRAINTGEFVAQSITDILTTGPFRPPQWNSQSPPLTMVVTDPSTNIDTAYVFDSILRLEHEQQSVITLNPIQTGPPISDHAFVMPARLVVEISMSDAMQPYTVGQWAGTPSKSVAAYQTLVDIQAQSLMVQLSTRLRQYDNMQIVSIVAREDKETKFALSATVTFSEILEAAVESVNSTVTFNDAALPQTTIATEVGELQPQQVPASIISQNNVSSLLQNNIAGLNLSSVPKVSGAGNWSSNNISSLASLFG